MNMDLFHCQDKYSKLEIYNDNWYKVGWDTYNTNDKIKSTGVAQTLPAAPRP